MQPNISPAISLHASAEVSAATPPVVTSNNNIASVTRTGAGIWVVNLATELDLADRIVTLTPIQANHGVLTLDPAVQTDSTIGVLGFLLAVATDLRWTIKVERINTPS